MFKIKPGNPPYHCQTNGGGSSFEVTAVYHQIFMESTAHRYGGACRSAYNMHAVVYGLTRTTDVDWLQTVGSTGSKISSGYDEK